MHDDPQSLKSENLPKYRWATFFQELLEGFKGQPVKVMAGTEFLHSETPDDSASLTNVDYDSHHKGILKHKGRLTVTTGGPQGETVTIDGPTIVWVYRDLEGEPVGVEIIDEENERVIIRFA